MKAMKLLKAIGVGLLLATPVAWADQPSHYAVEIIVFAQPNKSALTDEHWPFFNGELAVPDSAISWPVPVTDSDNNSDSANNSGSANPSAAANQTGSSVANSPVLSEWDKQVWQLNKTAARIKRSRFYNLLEHTAFIASRDDLSNGILVHLNSLDDAQNNLDPSTQDSKSTDLQTSSNGLLAIKLDHYFNLKFNFVLAIPTANLTSIDSSWDDNKFWGDYSYFHFLNSRRMRSKEINYIDFPLLGIIVLITPLGS